MESISSEFLDDTCNSKSSKSIIKTSTAAKENIKWNEDAFFNRQNLPQASESLFYPPVESSISALSEVTNVLKDSSKNPVFELNDTSLISDGANSSLGILHVENLSDLSGSSFCDLRNPVNPVKKRKPKQLQKCSRVCSEEINSEIKDLNFEEKFPNESKKILESLNEVHSEGNNTDGSSSSDIEYDGTNIPELNHDFDVLSLVDPKKAYSRTSTMNDAAQSRSSISSRKEENNRESSYSNSQIMKEELFKYDSSSEISKNSRQSIFEKVQPSYDSLYQQLLSEKDPGGKNNKARAPQTVKVCPFLDVSSFEVEAILQKQDQTSLSSDIEKARCSEGLYVDFCPDQISARSSSLRSSMKSELADISNKEKFGLSISSSQCKPSLGNEDLENEVLCGSYSQMSRTKFESQNESSEITENKGNSFGEFNQFSNKSSNSNLLLDGFPSFTGEENWCSRLGISESEFFSSEAAKEMLKGDKEAFEKEQMAQTLITNKVSGVSNWSPPNQLEVTAPSWFELSPNEGQSSNRQVSIGTLIRARTENLGSLSGDSESERPFFGTFVSTPPKGRSSSMFSSASKATDQSSIQASSFRNIRGSALSDILDEISTSDPSKFASKLLEKCMANVKASCQSLGMTQVDDTKNLSIEQNSSLQREFSPNVLSDIEESQSTLVRSASSNSICSQSKNDPDADSKPLTSESMQCMENSLNFSDVGSTSERESIKTTKSDASSKCSLSSQQSLPQGFSRCTSSCSNSCSNPISLQNAVSVQYGCMQYLNPGHEHNHCMMPNTYLLQQAGSSALPCPHICGQHVMQPNLLPITAPTSIQAGLPGSTLPPHLQGANLSYFGIQAPTELFFPAKLAVGDSQEMNLTVQNTSNVACTYHISCVSAYLNDNPLPFEMSGLNFNKLVPSGAASATDIKLVLAPKYEGKLKVTLQIDAFTNSVGQTLNITPGASVKTKIEYEVMQPSVSLSSKGKDTLNLGPVIEGSTFVEYISLFNNSEVAVPLRISLSNSSIADQIYFGLKEMDRQKYPASGAPRFLSPKVMLYRLPGTKNKSMPSHIDIPIVFESIKGRINSTVTAAVETPTLSEVLAFIKILASIGNANLVLKDPSQNPLLLKATRGSTCNHSLTVVNDGTLPVVYDFQIESESDSFLVSPTSVKLQPKQSTTISVTFSALTSEAVSGKLLAAAEPHGQVFSVIDIIGNVQANSYSLNRNNRISLSEPTRDSNKPCTSLQCNKKYISWPGTDVGKTIIHSFSVRNPRRETTEVKIFIKDSLQAFQLLDNTGKRTDSLLLSVNCMEEKKISIAFTAKDISSYSGLLCVKEGDENKKVYSKPLCGYGGSAKINVPGLVDGEGIGYCLGVEVPNKAETIYKNVMLHNTGLRAAFVKLILTYDGCVQNPVQKQAVINPSEFILLENEKKNVLVSLNNVEKSQVSNNEVILVLYGDEILRQGLRRRNKSSAFVSHDPLSNINFNVPFDGEDRVPYDSSVFHPTDKSFFYSNLKKQMIHIFYVGLNMSFSGMSFASVSTIQDSFANLTLNTATPSRRLTIECHSPPVKESSVQKVNRLSLPFEDDHLLKAAATEPSSDSIVDGMNNLRLQSWTVQPTELILDADNKDNRILLKSYSNHDMRFKVEWMVDVITVSPVSGTLPTNGEIGLRLSVINNNHSKLMDDYQGSIKIICDGMEKIVKVRVLKDQKRTTVSAADLSPRSGFLAESCYLDNTVVECSTSLQVENIALFPKIVELQKTRIGVLSEKVLNVQNPSKHSVTWNIKPSSMLFSQPLDDSLDSSSSFIDFPLSSGVLKSMETVNIVIKFTPRFEAEFSQFFELSLSYENGTEQSRSFKVIGEVNAETLSAVQKQIRDPQDGKSSILSKKKVKSEIFVDKDIYEYPTVAPGQKSTLGITIKNISSQDYVFSVTKPHFPFILNHSSVTIRSAKFLKIPVHFNPRRPSCYESEIKFISESGHELKVKLKGSCSA